MNSKLFIPKDQRQKTIPNVTIGFLSVTSPRRVNTLKPKEADSKTGQELIWWGGKAMSFSTYLDQCISPETLVEERWRLRLQTLLSLVPVYVLAAFFGPATPLFIAILALIGLGSFAMLDIGIGFSERHRDLSNRSDLPSPCPQFSARIVVKYSGIVTCKDVGVVTFMRGYLLYEGANCRFGIRTQDCRDLKAGPRSVFTLRARVETAVPLEITFYPITDLSRPNPTKNRRGLPSVVARWFDASASIVGKARFEESWSDWRLYEEAEVPHSTFPPIELFPDPLRILRSLNRSTVGGFYAGLLVLCLHAPPILAALIGVGAGLATFAGLSVLERAFRRYFASQV